MKRLLFILGFMSISLTAQENTDYESATFAMGIDTLNYRVLKPLNFDSNKKYPLVLFMHGSGERGNDNKAQLIHGSGLFTKEENRKKYNAFVVFPQCPSNSYWANIDYEDNENGLGFRFKENPEPMKPLKMVIQLMDSLIKSPNVDADRVYVTGLSMGGMGTFEMLYRRPDMFAAAAPICGGAHPKTSNHYANKIPVWVIHGSDDTVINPKYSIEMVQAIKNAGGSPRMSLYDNTGHDSWTKAFAEPDFLQWLFSKVKKN